MNLPVGASLIAIDIPHLMRDRAGRRRRCPRPLFPKFRIVRRLFGFYLDGARARVILKCTYCGFEAETLVVFDAGL